MAADVRRLIQRRQVRPGLHLHHRVALAVEEVQVLAVLEGSAQSVRDTLLASAACPTWLPAMLPP